MNCVKESKRIKEFAAEFKDESLASVTNLLGLWWEANPERSSSFPSKEEFEFFRDSLREQPDQGIAVTYNLPGQSSQTYMVKGTHIYNSRGREVFKEDGKHRNRIYANLAVMQGRAVVVEHNGAKYVVSNKGAIISVATGNMMNWGEENGDRKAILSLADEKFKSKSEAQKTTKDDQSTKPVPDAFTLQDAVRPVSDTPTVTGFERWQAANMIFDPQVRRDRVTYISRMFSYQIDKYIKETKDEIDRRMMEEKLKDDERASLAEQLHSLDRIQAVKEMHGPGGVFQRIKEEIFQKYMDLSEDEKIQQQLILINRRKNAAKYSDSQKLEAAKKRAAYKTQEYDKVLEYFDVLAEEAAHKLLITEGIVVSPDIIVPEYAKDEEGTADIEGEDDSDPIEKAEEQYKDGWMTNFREVSSHASLSKEVRAMIREIPGLDYKGRPEKDDLGHAKYFDAEFVHAVIIDKLKDMITPKDMIPLLMELVKTKPWVSQIIDKLKNDPVMFSKFYQDFRKDFVEYWIQKKVLQADGSYKIESFPINFSEGTYYLLDSWRSNYEEGNMLNEDSIYSKDGSIRKDKALLGLRTVEKLTNAVSNMVTQERLAYIENEDNFNTIVRLLNMIGVDPDPTILKVALHDIKVIPGAEVTEPIQILLNQLNIIFKDISDGKVTPSIAKDGSIKRDDLINTFSGAYNNIALMLSNVTEGAIESSVYENDKMYYAHVAPSYLGKLIKRLKNVTNDPNFDQFMQEEFGQYDWFKKNGEWRSDWVKRLASDSKMRDILEHKVLLNFDKAEYTEWDDLDYTRILIQEFFSDPNGKTAWYHVSILADAPSAEFIRFVRFTDGQEFDKRTGKKLTYKEAILNRMIDLVNQEYDRIQLVKEREKKFLDGDTSIVPIANYDVSYIEKEDGTIKRVAGGSEFKFIPELNTYTFENGETFLKRFDRLKEGSPSEFREFLLSTLEDIMETGFEDTYSDWMDIGLLDELDNGKFKNLPSDQFPSGQKKVISEIVNALNTARKILGDRFDAEMSSVLDSFNKGESVSDRRMTAIFNKVLTSLRDSGLTDSRVIEHIRKGLFTKNSIKDKLREYYWNSKFATSQIIELTTTDLAFYKNIEDFQKRYKEVHAPSLRLNTAAVYNGETVGREWEQTIYLADDEIVSSVINDITEILDAAIAKDDLTKSEKDYILSQLRKVNVADAQAYRSISSYRSVLVMSGQWTAEMETAYKHLTTPGEEFTMQDFNVIWQTKKPYLYTQINNDSGVENSSGIKTPVQHKNSEFLLMALFQAVAGKSLARSGKLRAINDFMEKYSIDVVQFESTTKVGKQGVININTQVNLSEEELAELDRKLAAKEISKEQYNKIIKDHTTRVESYEDTMRILEKATGAGKGPLNPNVVHRVSYEDYGFQTATPEHIIDTTQLVGTQIRKLITADMSDYAKITINGREKTKKEWLDLYNRINTENILQKFRKISEIFADPKKVEEILKEEIRSNSKYSHDLLMACTLNDEGYFNIPLFDPVQSQRIQTLLNSIIKSRVTKQKIKGGSLIQVSSYGLTDDLKIVFEGEGENKRIKYMECYMPAYSRKFYEPLMGKDGLLDVTKLPDSLRKAIGYRVPTEDKYSMVPLYIKGFLPQQNGSAIMLPAEITTLSGSDFDVDKLYIMLPEFRLRKVYDLKAAWSDFYNDLSNQDIVSEIQINLEEALTDYIDKHPEDDDINIDEYLEFIQNQGVKKYQLSVTAQDRFSKWFKSRKKNYYIKTNIEKVEYDYDKLPQDQSERARNNALIDLMWGVLTNPDTAPKILTPGGFDKQKIADRIVTILDSISLEDIRKIVGSSDITKLLDKDLDFLDSLASSSKRKLDPLSPRTQVILHQQNVVGGIMIGIYANHNANHALIQHTNLEVNYIGEFTFAGESYTSLHEIKNKKGDFISRNNANFLAASVDNVKDNTLHATNQNTFTGDASMFLSRLGYRPAEIAILMRQPIVMEMTKRYFRESREGKTAETIIKKVLEDWIKSSGMHSDLEWKDVKYRNKFELLPMMEDISKFKDLDKMSKEDRINFLRRQVTVGLLFQRVWRNGNVLKSLVQATRADTQGGAAGPTIADTMNKVQKVESFLEDSTKVTFPFNNAQVIFTNGLDYAESIDELREMLINSPLSYVQAFYTLGVEGSMRMLKPYFPQFNRNFMEVLDGREFAFDGLRSYTKSGRLKVKTINSIYNDLLAYIMTKTPFFGSSLTESGELLPATEKRRIFINNFPKEFKRIVEDNPEVAELGLIQRLKTVLEGANNPVDVLNFRNVGTLTSILRERFMNDWSTLLYMDNKDANILAQSLFLYCFFRNGFAFSPNSFIHLAPVILRMAIPEYIETLRNIATEDGLGQFIEQYIYNHLDNREFVPSIPDSSLISFTNDKGKIKSEITIGLEDIYNPANETFIKEVTDYPNGDKEFELMRFIGKRIKGKWYYYRADRPYLHGEVVYRRIESLGYKNNFLEYEYGREASDIETVIKKNKTDPTTVAEPSDPIEEVEGGEIKTREESAGEREIIDNAVKETYGKSLDTAGETPSNSLSSISPNTEYKDADNNDICG